MAEKTVSFASSSFCDSENTSALSNSVRHTSTPFVHRQTTSELLDGSIFDPPKERSSLEISSIPPSNDTSREKCESVSEDVSSCALLDRSFIQSSINLTDSALTAKETSSKEIDGEKVSVTDSIVDNKMMVSRESTNDIHVVVSSQKDEGENKPEDHVPLIADVSKDDACLEGKTINDGSSMGNHLKEEGGTCDTEQSTNGSNGQLSAVQSLSDEGVHSTSSSNITSRYFKDNTKQTIAKSSPAKKRKRMTMAEKRTLEALEAFGGGLDAVLIKTESFGDKLDKQREMIKAMESSAGEPKSKRTRLAVAKTEAEQLFKNIPLGKEKEDKTSTSLKQQDSSNSTATNEGRRMTRLERAKLEAMQSFGGSGLDELLAVKKVKTNSEAIAESQNSDDKENANGTDDQ